jgi:Uma2 family endonuclease
MSAAQQLQPIAINDYLRGEVGAKQKHEYIDGSVYAMAGASNNHNLIATNATAELHGQLRGKPCRVFNSDAKIRVRNSSGTRFYYPDLSVVCEPNPANDSFHDSPVVVVEVISASTRRTDEYEKRESYLLIESLSVYILVEQKAPAALVYRRCENGFVAESYLGLESVIPLPEIKCDLALADVYANAIFPSAEQVREQQEHFELTGELPVEFVF